MNRPPFPAPGDIVRIRDQRWQVLRCTPEGDCALIDVSLADPASSPLRASFIMPFDRVERLPAVEGPRRVRPTEWRRIARRVLADALPHWWSLRAARQADITLLPFQLEPALALTRRQATRFLIADAVGLGKTIQAGLMVAETLDRVPAAHVLVICPASLRDQWSGELSSRFALEASVLDSASLSVRAGGFGAGTNPWSALPLIIASIDFVKRPEVIRALEPVVWDLVVFDEAHALSGRSDRAAVAAALASRARAVVMLTATPHSGDDQAFQRLSGIGRLEGDAPLRTFRRDRDVLGSGPGRRTTTWHVKPTSEERWMHDALHEYTQLALRDGLSAGVLALQVLARRAASSAASLARSVERRIALLEEEPRTTPQLALPYYPPADDDAAPDAELQQAALTDRHLELQLLRRLLARATAAARHESKTRWLLRFLTRCAEPAIVFTQYRDTLATLAGSLTPDASCLHGGMTGRERRWSAQRFTHGEAPLLLATDAASEGLNLHQRCRLVINLELPWTPLRLEQRAGRVDRLGQHRRVHVLHLVAAGTGEEQTAAELRGRAHHADGALPATTACSVVALEECRRIELARQLGRHAAQRLPSRPVFTAGRRTGRSIRAFRVALVDRRGLRIWELLVACGARAFPIDFEPVRHLREVIRRAEADALESLGTATVAAMTRERDIAAALRQTHARMSAALLQAGLFERRGERTADAQAAIFDEAISATETRLSVLAASDTASFADPRLAFSLERQPS